MWKLWHGSHIVNHCVICKRTILRVSSFKLSTSTNEALIRRSFLVTSHIVKLICHTFFELDLDFFTADFTSQHAGISISNPAVSTEEGSVATATEPTKACSSRHDIAHQAYQFQSLPRSASPPGRGRQRRRARSQSPLQCRLYQGILEKVDFECFGVRFVLSLFAQNLLIENCIVYTIFLSASIGKMGGLQKSARYILTPYNVRWGSTLPNAIC
jgi:hypothetical protein